MTEPGANATGGTFATRLSRLFSSVKRDDGTSYGKPEVAEFIGVSRGYLYDLLKGKNEPSHSVVVKLAEFFGVELEYFADTERGRDLNQQYDLLAKLGEQNARHIAARASQLSPEQLRSVMEFIDFQAGRSSKDHPSE
ncbi:helix-turn-helix domain-containing protein [Actinopolyspora halophila]|uniref:helix-turn-helix domain-containing protein n=1 Tax=Actinopolyspora halophila TaxID=1850 RepID=UPI000378AD25|nr:helix-turn-helix transcriptional regulator [Actinopolyspora halophila]